MKIDSTSIDIVSSATIETGAKTNRVRLKSQPAPRVPCPRCEGRGYTRRSGNTCGRCKGNKTIQASTARPVRYRADLECRGKGAKAICVSLSRAELAAIDEACERTQMARSHFLRQAAKHFIAKVIP